MTDNSKVALTEAVKAAEAGYKIVPLHGINNIFRCTCNRINCASPGKHPRHRNWEVNATTNIDQIRMWYKELPDGNFGILTGKVGGLIVVDLDNKNGIVGEKSLIKWGYENKVRITDTLTVHTGGGGKHLYFKNPIQKISAKVGILPGVDIRCDSELVVCPGSKHASGNLYRWNNEIINMNELPDIPRAFVDFIVECADGLYPGSAYNEERYLDDSRKCLNDFFSSLPQITINLYGNLTINLEKPAI